MIYKVLPYFVFKKLFGDRKKYGLVVQPEDPDLKKWDTQVMTFYTHSQKGKTGSKVNHYGFKIIKEIDFSGKVLLESGPGIIEHLDYNPTRPVEYILADINPDFLEQSELALKEKYQVKNIKILPIESNKINLEDNSVDIVLTFHQLEHIYELDDYLQELKRILRPGGKLIGSVPVEGGIAWGLGRFLTSRRYAINKLNLNYDKIICWKHPNFVDKIKTSLDANFTRIKSVRKPFRVLPFDFNLSWSYIYLKPE